MRPPPGGAPDMLRWGDWDHLCACALTTFSLWVGACGCGCPDAPGAGCVFCGKLHSGCR